MTNNTEKKFISKFSAEAIETILEEGVTGLSGGTLSEQIAKLQAGLKEVTELNNQLNEYIETLKEKLKEVEGYSEEIKKAQNTASQAMSEATTNTTDVSNLKVIIGSSGDTSDSTIFGKFNDYVASKDFEDIFASNVIRVGLVDNSALSNSLSGYFKSSSFEDTFNNNVTKAGLITSSVVNDKIISFVGASDFNTGVQKVGSTVFVKDSDFSSKFNSNVASVGLITSSNVDSKLSNYATNDSVTGTKNSLQSDISNRLTVAEGTFNQQIADGKTTLSN